MSPPWNIQSFMLPVLIFLALCPTHGRCAIPVLQQRAENVVTFTTGPGDPSTAPDLVDEGQFISSMLNSTNTYRLQHGAVPLVWNQTLENFSEDYLNKVAPTDGSSLPSCIFEHSNGPYGENLAIGCTSVSVCVDAWGNERETGPYQYGNPDGYDPKTGHFTQLVWKDTTNVGCARRMCAAGTTTEGGQYTEGWYIVCEYWPRGNVMGQFDTEVGGYQGNQPLGPPPGGAAAALGAFGAGEWLWKGLVMGLACALPVIL